MAHFHDMYYRQFLLQKKLIEKGGKSSSFDPSRTDEEIEERFNYTLLLLIKEVTEVLDEMNSKRHSKEKKEVDRYAVLEELIDILKYWMNLCIIYDFGSTEIVEAFNSKSAKVEKKLLGESLNADC